MKYINENGVKPDIAEGVEMDALIDCIHKVTIEEDVFSGHDIMILTGGHDPYLFGQSRKVSYGGGPVTIKEGAWLGTRCIIIGPVTIGKHAVIGAGAVINKDVPDYALAVGNPMVIKKYYAH